MDGFQRRREEKKRQILSTALTLFLEHGPKSVSVSEIAARAGVSQVTIYNYFETKQTLIDSVSVYYIDQLYEQFSQIVHNDLPFKEKISQLIFNKKQASNLHEEFYQHLMTDPAIQKAYEERALPLFLDLIEQGRSQNQISPSISNHVIILHLTMLQQLNTQQPTELLPFAEEIMEMFFYGLSGSEVKRV